MFYSLIYQVKGLSETMSYSFGSRENMIAFIKQLHRGIATIDGKLYKGIESFSHFELRQKNYIQETCTKGEYITSFGEDGHPNFEGGPTGVFFSPIDEDITNITLDECKMTSEDKNIYFDGEYLWIYGEDFQFKGDTNIRFLVELIFKTQKRLNQNIFDYSEILNSGEILMIGHSLPKLLDYDFCWNTVKKRFPIIKKELGLKEDFIKFSTEGVEIII